MAPKDLVKALLSLRLIQLDNKFIIKRYITPLDLVYDKFMNTTAIIERRVAAKLANRNMVHFIEAGQRPPNYFQGVPGYLNLISTIKPSFKENFADFEDLKKDLIENEEHDVIIVSLSKNTITYESKFFKPEVFYFAPYN